MRSRNDDRHRPMSWCFRIRFRLPERLQLESPDKTIVLADLSPGAERVELRATAREDVGISDSRDLAVIGSGFASEAEALASGERWRGIVQKGLARMNIGADFGDRAPKGAVTTHGLRQLEAAHGGRLVNDVHGLMAFKCDPWPQFVGIGGGLVVGKSGAALRSVISAAARLGVGMSDRERLAYDLYSGSFSQPSPDARFAMLMMAVETLIEPEPRSPDVAQYVERLIGETRDSQLPPSEIESIAGALKWLYAESIGQAGRHLARQLGDRRYMDEEPARFFTRCYEMRSRLVHGDDPRPSAGDVATRAASLELFTSQLLSIELLGEVDG